MKKKDFIFNDYHNKSTTNGYSRNYGGLFYNRWFITNNYMNNTKAILKSLSECTYCHTFRKFIRNQKIESESWDDLWNFRVEIIASCRQTIFTWDIFLFPWTLKHRINRFCNIYLIFRLEGHHCTMQQVMGRGRMWNYWFRGERM